MHAFLTTIIIKNIKFNERIFFSSAVHLVKHLIRLVNYEIRHLENGQDQRRRLLALPLHFNEMNMVEFEINARPGSMLHLVGFINKFFYIRF